MSSSAVSSSSAVVSFPTVRRLCDSEIQTIMHYLSTADLSRAERTCRAWMHAANSEDNYNPWKKIVEKDYEKFKEKYPNVTSFEYIYRNRFRMTDQSLAEWALRRAGVDIDVPPHAPIPDEPCPFGTSKLFYFPGTLYGQKPCLDTLQTVYNYLTGSPYSHYLNNLSVQKRGEIVTEPLGISGWYEMVIVNYRGSVAAQKEFVEHNGHGQWKMARVSQMMYAEVVSTALGNPFLGNLSAFSFEETEFKCHLAIFGGSSIAAPAVCNCLDSMYKEQGVVALRKVTTNSGLGNRIRQILRQVWK